ncbi:hypothetical protein [Pseudorhodoferax soli]|uniref:PXPV repeat-containing protein n=1 Tax=Pseudorhodoferax soli TaxID=545864 RepID=A0A368XVX7_9BURK|nr:hypothetical protein [Pseudorhodoferax soli]RCW70184.1 hypothetical protein DES41_105122 [Pseudorhodoferax soli]
MKRLSLLAVLAVAALSGCVVAPVGPGYYGYRRPVVVAPPVVGPPVVIVRPGYEGRPRYDDDRGYGHGRRWRRDD